MVTFGILVEGYKDKSVIEALVSKIYPQNNCLCFPYGGKQRLMEKFPGYLECFKYSDVNKALITRDKDSQCAKELAARIHEKQQNRNYPFPVKFCLIKEEIEAWLLADENAISEVVGEKVSRINENLEDIKHPKEKLQNILSKSNISFTPEILRKIAEAADLRKVEYRCPSFRRFRDYLLDC
ncbi:MAG: DUF4276 family protein [Deltaproteobacteria bacterium]|nr:DUF4276 family protein [Deltaproteobacteria bacterium]